MRFLSGHFAVLSYSKDLTNPEALFHPFAALAIGSDSEGFAFGYLCAHSQDKEVPLPFIFNIVMGSLQDLLFGSLREEYSMSDFMKMLPRSYTHTNLLVSTWDPLTLDARGEDIQRILQSKAQEALGFDAKTPGRVIIHYGERMG